MLFGADYYKLSENLEPEKLAKEITDHAGAAYIKHWQTQRHKTQSL